MVINMNLEINDLMLEQYKISFNIFSDQSYIIYDNGNFTDKFLKVLLGINKPEFGEVLYNKTNVFDHKEYFKKRIYLDCTKKYLSTLTPSIINDILNYKYNLSFNSSKFKKVVDDLNVRKGTKVSSLYQFTKEANTCVNYALLKGLEKDLVFINEPLIHLNDKQVKDYILNELFNKKIYQTVIIKTNNLEDYIQKPVKIIWFANTDVYVIDPNKDKFILVMTELDIKKCIYTYQNGFKVCYDLTKEELKILSENKVKYKEISFSEMFKLKKRFLNE